MLNSKKVNTDNNYYYKNKFFVNENVIFPDN